jgi:hypothetical protein
VTTLIPVGTAASANKEIGGTGDGYVGTYVIEIVDEGSAAFTSIKVSARALGRGATAATVTTFPTYLAITNRATGAVVAGTTGVTAAGIYSVDLSGCECQLEVVRSAGTYSAHGVPLAG